MHTVIAAGAGFLAAVLWFDLMFDVQARRAGAVPAQVLASIAAYYRRVTIEARPMSQLIAAVMLVVLGASIVEVVRGRDAWWVVWPSLGAAGLAIGLALSRTVPNAVRLGRAQDPVEIQSRLARSILRDHQLCLAAIAVVLGLQFVAAFS
jgi:hypothetical protein